MISSLIIPLLAIIAISFVASALLLWAWKRARVNKVADAENANNRQRRFQHSLNDLERAYNEKRMGEKEYSYHKNKLTEHYETMSKPYKKDGNAKGLLIAIIALLPLASILFYWQFVYTPETGKFLQDQAQMQKMAEAIMQGDWDNTGAEKIAAVDMARVMQAKLGYTEKDVDGWLEVGRLYAQAGINQLAMQSYTRAYQIAPQREDTRISYAWASMLEGQGLTPQAEQLLRSVLRDNPRNESALLTLGFAFFQREDYQAAIQSWDALLQQRDPESEGAKILKQQIAEAQRRLEQPANQPWEIMVQVDTPEGDSAQLPEQAVLFVFAKAEDSSAPVAVQRVEQPSFPITVTLSDAQAMIAARKLSNYQQIQVSAKLSISGNPSIDDSDWVAQAIDINRETILPVQLRLNKP